jgi:acyl carrier protein
MMDAAIRGAKGAAADGEGEGAVRAQVRAFLTTNFFVADPAALGDGTSLLDAGVIDSTGVLEVIAYLERDFGLKVADEEILPENLDSIERIAGFIARKR